MGELGKRIRTFHALRDLGADRQMRQRIRSSILRVENEETRQIGVGVLQRVKSAQGWHDTLKI